MVTDWLEQQAISRVRRLPPSMREFHLVGMFAIVLAVLTAGGLTLLYAFVLTSVDASQIPLEERLHVLLNLGCLAWVALAAWRARGQLDSKLGQVLMMAILVYGVIFLLILGGRWFFSRSMLLSSFFAVVVMGFAIVLLKHRLSVQRIGIIGPLAPAVKPSTALGQVVTDPATDLRAFDILLVAFTDTVDGAWARAMSRAMLAGCTVRHIGEYVEESRGAVSLQHFDIEQIPDFSLTSYRHFKRFLDVVAVLFTLPVSLLLIAVSAALILLTMGAPVLFVQQRVGLGGRVFKIWKLRTMRRDDSRPEGGAAVPRDPRVTFVGRFLRRFRLDELPQLWNVLRGDMTLIGPRPEAVAFHDEYLRHTPSWAYRTLVRPGITGWAQVCTEPSANVEEARRKLAYDLYYIKRMSLVLDLKIALRTLWTITSGSGVR